jgi:hypothetical protein
MARVVRERIKSARNQTKPACYTGYCDCDAVSALQTPCAQPVPHTAVYTKTDGIVDWRVCVNEDPAMNYEVKGTHVGLVFNRSVYELIATRLAQKR